MRRAASLLAISFGLLPACGGGGQGAGADAAAFDVAAGEPDGIADGGADDRGPVPDGPITADPEIVIGGTPCNGWQALCPKRYDQIAFPTTHAAMAVAFPPFRFPAQQKSVRAQLDENIRALMLEVHDIDGVLSVCADDCALGSTPLANGLGGVRGFMDDNPRQVVTLLVDNHVPAARVVSALDDAGLTRWLHTQPRGEAWPTLAAMIDGDRRLVVFVADAVDAPDTLIPLWDVAFATRADFHAPEEVTCQPGHGDAQKPLLLVLHILTTPGGADDGGAGVGHPTTDLAAEINAYPFTINRLRACQVQYGRVPNWVAVDYYDQSEVLRATEELNGLIPASTGP